MRSTQSSSFRLLLATAASLVLGLTMGSAGTAQACGGLFCDTQPVSQAFERILFEVHGDDTVTTTVEITYNGDPEAFAWVVPVPDTPSLDVVSPSTLAMLDTATFPVIIPPPMTCTESAGPPGMFSDSASGASDDDDAMEDGGVDVEDLPVVGPFDPEVVSSEDPAALIEWLNDNGYLITEEMEPLVADYVAQGMKFLGMKLAPGAGVQDIAPIQMNYPADRPLIPLVLTAVAADPEMGVLIFVAANQRWESDNFINLEVDKEDVQFHPLTGENNYYPLTSWMIDQAGGKGVITEYAQSSADTGSLVNNTTLAVSDNDEARAYLQNLFMRRGYITRLFSRASAWEMDTDPSFRASTEGDVSRTIDLSDRPAIEVCSTGPNEDFDVPCGDMYCGEGARCATTKDGIDGCVCELGSVARRIQAPAGPGLGVVDTVYCADGSFDMLASARADGDTPDACATASCGENGTCVDNNGFPSCSCEDGYAAITFAGELTCSEVQQTFGPDQLLWASQGCSSSCNAASEDGRSGLALAALLLPLIAVRRRSRRSRRSL